MTNAQLQIIKRALFDAEIIEIKKLEAFPEVKIAHSPTYVQKIAELREKTKRRESSAISFSPRRKIVILIATIIILALTVTACVFGEQVKDFFFEIYESYTLVEVKGEPDGGEFEQYTPSFIPDDYILIDNKVNTISSRAIWHNGSHYIYLDQNKQSSGKTTIDTEDCTISTTIVGDNKIYYTLKNHTYSLLWLDDGYQFSLVCHSSIAWDKIENMITSLSCTKKE